MSTHFIKLDDEGYLLNDQGIRLSDESLGLSFFSSLRLDESFTLHATLGQQAVIVEAFDEPFMARTLDFKNGDVIATGAYGFKAQLDLESLSLDEWDRVHGLTKAGLPFGMTRAAQAQFFDALEGFDDENVTLNGKTYPTPSWLIPHDEIKNSKFWSDIYQNEKPGWDLGQAAPALKDVLPQLKLAKSRVLILGSGAGHDAAHFAEQGHMVTAIDFSEEAIHQAKSLHSEKANLKFIQADAFELPEDIGRFDLIFEHTCYCAVDPDRRNQLVQVWKRHLVDRGHLLGVFFTMSKRIGPPYGGSEWELKQRLSPHFDFLYWTRWRHSLPRRLGRELVIYGQKK